MASPEESFISDTTGSPKESLTSDSLESPEPSLISDSLGSLGYISGEEVPVVLSHELVGLLSEQLYGSPIKAIEELVVNAYDADAKECRIVVPSADNDTDFMAVYDNGIGMDHQTIRDLWNIGRSRKREEQIEILRSRKQIGKFGIGKLATYSVATKPKPRWDVHSPEAGNWAGNLAGVLRPLTAGPSGSGASPRLSG